MYLCAFFRLLANLKLKENTSCGIRFPMLELSVRFRQGRRACGGDLYVRENQAKLTPFTVFVTLGGE
jgi:hypothetical protein